MDAQDRVGESVKTALPVIRDGDAVGQTPTQRIVVQFGERRGTPTCQVDVSAPLSVS